MKVKQFEDLLDIWKLIGKDPSSKSILLAPDGVHVAGMHVGASKFKELPIETVLVDGENLTGAIKLFSPTANLGIKQTEASIILTAGKRRAVLRVNAAEKPIPIEKPTSPKFRTKRLRAAIPFLRSCTSGGVLTPILTGIRFLKPKNKALILEATDGEIRYGRLPLPMPVNASGLVVPAADLEQALSLMIGAVKMQFIGSHLHISDGKTVLKLATLLGKYPDMSPLKKKKRPHSLIIKRSNLETAIEAAILLDSDRLVTLVIKEKRASLVIQGQETGGFRQPIGKTNLKDIEITFDANWLEAAANLGAEVKLEYKNSRTAVLFTGNKRSLWLAPIPK